MEKKVQLDRGKIVKELRVLKKTYSFYKRIEMVPALICAFSGLWILIDIIRCYKIIISNGNVFVPWSIVAIVCSLLLYKILNKIKLSVQRKYEMVFKRMMAEPILRSTFENIKYNPEKGFSRHEVKKMQLLLMNISLDEHFESEDLIEAEYMGVQFMQSDILLSEYRRRNDNYIRPKDYEGREILIDGRLARFSYKLDIKGVVQIATKKGMKWKRYMGKKRVEVEDTEFNKNFDVFADDEHSVFYALTPQVIDYFNSLRVGNKEQIAATMDGEFLYVLRYGKGGLFKADIKEEFDIDQKEKQIYAEIAEMQRLVKVLHLHKRAERE